MQTIDYIREYGLASLCEKYAIKASRGQKYPNLVLLKYSQIDSPMGERIVQECRGLILDESDNWKVVSRSFDKFFNYGEGHAAPINWNAARVYEKLDGSLCTLYCYKGEWHVATSGTPDASGYVQSGPFATFADLFWATFSSLGYKTPNPDLWNGRTFMFELMTPYNRILVCHREPQLTLIGARSLETGELDVRDVADWLGWDCVKSFPLTTLDECVNAANQLNPMDAEGYVVCDNKFDRVKVKSPQYVALSHLKEGMSGRRLLEIVKANESSEFLNYFPEFADAYNNTREQFDALCREIDMAYVQIRNIPEQKEFALQAIKTRCSGALFAIRKGLYKTAREFFADSSVGVLEKIIKPQVKLMEAA